MSIEGNEHQDLPLERLRERVVQPQHNHQPFSENVLRPRLLKDYIGQRSARSKLEVFMGAAQKRQRALDHVLLSGPPGLGKTTLAHIIAQEMGGQLHMAPGPTLEKSADLYGILVNLQEGDVLFVDEIHRLSRSIEESFYPAMEDRTLQVLMGQGAAAQPITLPLPDFTLVGATTQSGKLSAPFRDRFGIHLNLDFYAQDEIEAILQRSADILGVELSSSELNAVAQRSRGTPRIANRLLARVRDFVEVLRQGPEQNASSSISSETWSQIAKISTDSESDELEAVHKALDFLDVDDSGLQPLDRRYLKVLCSQFHGGPAGVEALAASLSEDKSTLEELVESFLLKESFIIRTPRGRMATEKAYLHMGLVK